MESRPAAAARRQRGWAGAGTGVADVAEYAGRALRERSVAAQASCRCKIDIPLFDVLWREGARRHRHRCRRRRRRRGRQLVGSKKKVWALSSLPAFCQTQYFANSAAPLPAALSPSHFSPVASRPGAPPPKPACSSHGVRPQAGSRCRGRGGWQHEGSPANCRRAGSPRRRRRSRQLPPPPRTARPAHRPSPLLRSCFNCCFGGGSSRPKDDGEELLPWGSSLQAEPRRGWKPARGQAAPAFGQGALRPDLFGESSPSPQQRRKQKGERASGQHCA